MKRFKFSIAMAALVLAASVTRPILADSPFAIATLNGQVYFALEEHNGVLMVWSTTSDEEWCELPQLDDYGSYISGPAIALRSTGEIDVVAQGPSNTLMYYWWFPGQNYWNRFMIASSGTTFSAPAIAVRSTGEAHIVVQGPNHSLMYYSSYVAFPFGGWSSKVIGNSNTAFSNPAIAVRSTGEADVVFQGAWNSLMYYWSPAGSSQWYSTFIQNSSLGLFYTTYSAPAIAVRPSGEADIVAQGPNNSLMYYTALPGTAWTTTTMIAGPGTTASAPAIFVRNNADPVGEVDIVASNLNNQVVYYWANPGPLNWGSFVIDLGFPSGLSPVITIRTNSDVEADVLALHDSVNYGLNYYYAFPGSAWFGGWKL